MHRDEFDDDWADLNGGANNKKNKPNHKPLDHLDVLRNAFDDERDDLHKVKKDRADKHLRNVKSMLQGMATFQNKKF